ncbi:MAG: redoxin domain-containing protein [Bacteroidales bacterium]|nr:redoxin domain-containing protein [Bacteroidales bacterium]
MNKLFVFLLLLAFFVSKAQTTLTEAVDFHVKTIYGETIYLFPLLDDNQQIVVIDFFSTSCGPCQDYAPDFQAAYEKFGYNEGNVYFMGINWGNDNQGVYEFDSVFGLTYPTASGSQGGGNLVFNDYNILSYPTVVVITPDHQIVEQYIWVPDEDNITQAVLNAGGIIVGVDKLNESESDKVMVFPQPAFDYLHVNSGFGASANVTLKLLNLAGQNLITHQAFLPAGENHDLVLDIGGVPNGAYVLVIEGDSGFHVHKKVMVVNN